VTAERTKRRSRQPRWLFVVRVVTVGIVVAQLALMFAPDAFSGLIRWPLWAQFLVGTAVLAALVLEVLSAAGMLGRSDG
jgi:hypothetical protein